MLWTWVPNPGQHRDDSNPKSQSSAPIVHSTNAEVPTPSLPPHPDPWLQQILTAVLAEPQDDLHRLAYADRCEDQGDLDRAEFIRAQLACHASIVQSRRWLAGSAAEPDSACRYCQLVGRARELLRQASPPPACASGLAWLQKDGWSLPWQEADPRDEEQPVRWSWERGFVAGISCSLAEWLEHGPRLVRLQPVSGVHLRDRMPRTRPLKKPAIWSWTREDTDTFPGDATHAPFAWWLPPALFDALPGERQYPTGLPATAGLPWKEYATAGEACSALCGALLAWARVGQPFQADTPHQESAWKG